MEGKSWINYALKYLVKSVFVFAKKSVKNLIESDKEAEIIVELL